MFTGLIEEIGTLRRSARQGQAMVLIIEAKKVLEDVQIGDSIAVNGVCLTVIDYDQSCFTADVMPETFRHTTLHQLKPGQPVNLERAMSAKGRFGGHMVQGHVDTTAQIVKRESEDNAVYFAFTPQDLSTLKYIVAKGSVTIDGISLTVVEADEEQFSVSIIPHTLQETVLKYKFPGDYINLECDLLGKYVEKLLFYADGSDRQPASVSGSRSGLSRQFLLDNGF
ncbi:riboflavin synthase [Paenibacillus senegalensis]|uniref:riboflavin synthase n=1 Tax=Paenibacillus senegalensis TaxID=1465766 RepID=UPI00028851F7|nr:riboflavin synthase [Paenibacillus senegalensis]